MRIDVHAYLGHWPYRRLRGNTADGLLDRMNKYGVDLAVVSNIEGIFYKNTQPANEDLAQAVKAHRDRFIPFAVINPTYAGWKRDFETCAGRLSMKGLRLYPQYHDYRITDPACIELVKMAAGRGMPVAFSLRLIDDRQRSWLDIDRELTLGEIASLVKLAPEAKYMVLHAVAVRERGGNRNEAMESEEVISLFKRAEIVFDTVRGSGSGVVGPNAYDLWAAIQTYGREKLAFGTAAPFMDYLSPFLRILALKEADAPTQSLIWGGNVRRLLELR
jgi:predicted TIM-barrel fold metal-dependent hydrolase